MGYGEPLSSSSNLKGRDWIDLLARMIYGEAENQTEEGKRGVAFIAYKSCGYDCISNNSDYK